MAVRIRWILNRSLLCMSTMVIFAALLLLLFGCFHCESVLTSYAAFPVKDNANAAEHANQSPVRRSSECKNQNDLACNNRTYTAVWPDGLISSLEIRNLSFNSRDVASFCRNSTFLVIVVCSAVENRALRDVIRTTWGRELDLDVKIIFLVGRQFNSAIDESIEQEEKQFGDVIQANFMDSYANLTLKSIAMLRWITSYCAGAKFLLKSDDDTFINTRLLVKNLRSTVHRRFIMGNVIALAQPVRKINEKWFTPMFIYNKTSYPTYVSGAAYVISGDALLKLFLACFRIPLFWIEDVYVTGLVANEAKVQHIHNGKFDGFKELTDMCSIRNHIVRHRITVDEMRSLWSIVEKPTFNCP